MPRRVPYSAACALVPASLMAAPSPEMSVQAAEEALLRAAVEAALGSDPGVNPESEADGERLPVTLKARRVGRVAHVQARLPDGRTASLLFRYDGHAWRKVAPAG